MVIKNKTINLSTDIRKQPLMGYKDHNSFYASRKWRRLREYKFSLNPLCEKCLLEGKRVVAEEVDHIIPIFENEDLALEVTNLQSLCKSCHSSKTATDKSQRGKGKIINKKFDV